MYKRHGAKIMGTAGLLALWLSVLVSAALASPQFQTIPTMPPPSSTPSVTPTRVVQPTPTHVVPTATFVRVTSVPPTPTLHIAPSDTAAIVSYSPTSPVFTITQTPSPSQLPIGTATPKPTIFSSVATEIPSIPTESQTPAEPGVSNIGWIGLIGGGAVLIVVVLLGVWLSVRKKNDHPVDDHKIP